MDRFVTDPARFAAAGSLGDCARLPEPAPGIVACPEPEPEPEPDPDLHDDGYGA
ncbi:hypothetical protein ACIA8F_16425 [Streptomyces sp. NPDC051563]|uniref:hypothetical protein n=1 Tax=Streptomyces sp. NPDC051563 TaxID=3365659 RepID=UPI003791A027